MFCDNCGQELADDAKFCSKCGNVIKTKCKNIYLALILTFLITGLGSVYAGNIKKGAVLFLARLVFIVLGGYIANFFIILSILVWAYAFYEAYCDVQIANGHKNPKLLDDFQKWDQKGKTIAILIICVISIVLIFSCVGIPIIDNYTPEDLSNYHHHYSSGGGSSSSSHSSHYGGVDTSPNTVAKNDPDSYYDYYDYGDNDKIDEYLESQGFD